MPKIVAMNDLSIKPMTSADAERLIESGKLRWLCRMYDVRVVGLRDKLLSDDL